MMTDASGAVISNVTRDPWGNAILLAGNATIQLGYPGQWHDGTSGLYQNWNRDYDPTLGRYIETDPIGLAGGSNLYAYVGGNPVNAIDPLGLQAAAAVGSAFAADLVIPDPSDVAWPKWALWGGVFAVAVCIDWVTDDDQAPIFDRAGHRKGKRPSTKGKHEAGDARRGADRGGERGDIRRRPSRKRPDKHKGPWP